MALENSQWVIVWRVIASPNVKLDPDWKMRGLISPSTTTPRKCICLDCLVDLLEEKERYPDEITTNPFDDPITRDPIFVLTHLGGRN